MRRVSSRTHTHYFQGVKIQREPMLKTLRMGEDVEDWNPRALLVGM